MKPATTITKVCRVLSEFRNRPSMGVTDLARRTGLLPSDVHRILSSLQPYGFIDQNPDTKTYRLGAGLLKLGLTVLQRSELCEKARPILKRLSDQVQATAHMAIFDSRELDIFLAEQIDFPEQIPFKACLGAPADPVCTALGKTIMANTDRETALLLLKKSGDRTTDIPSQLSRLEGELRMIKNQGYGLDLEEFAKGACCIGAPVRDYSGNTVGAISISMTARRFYHCYGSQLASQIKACAAELSAAIGYNPGPLATSSHFPPRISIEQ